MSLFQISVVKKYLAQIDVEKLKLSFIEYKEFYQDQERINNIRLLKEENYQEGFLREIFCDTLGYTINPNKNYNLTTEYKNETDSKKADGALLLEGKAVGVIELKSTKTINLDQITDQAFNYKNHQSNCRYVITSNFEKLRFYIDNATDYEEFDLFNLDFNSFVKLYLFISKESIFNSIPAKLKDESRLHEETISDHLYKDYQEFKNKIFQNLIKNNPQHNKLILFQKSQKLLDRMLFVLFAEDTGLVPPNAIMKIIDQWQQFKDLDEPVTLYSRFIKFFHHLDVGHKYSEYELPPYNGGLFQHDEILDAAVIEDDLLKEGTIKLSSYDYNSEVDVNILGHIFEHSLNEIEEKTAELEGCEIEKSKTRRKKEGVYYTPKYITKYIVDNTVGALAREKKEELGLLQIDDDILRTSSTKKAKELYYNKFIAYRDYLLTLKILDPACGSGAFLNQALDFLIKEHIWIDEQISILLNQPLTISDNGKDILEKNLYGVDINEEAIEIAKLSLWLRTAKKGRKLSDLSEHIKCGNSLIDDPSIAGDKAFNWNNEFEEVMKNGGFDVVIGNPPYGTIVNKEVKSYFKKNYSSFNGNLENYGFFIEKIYLLAKYKGRIGFIAPLTWFTISQFEKLRELVLTSTIVTIVNFTTKVFRDADLDTTIMVMSKQKIEGNKVEVLSPTFEIYDDLSRYTISIHNQVDWLNNSSHRMDISVKSDVTFLIKKISSNKVLLKTICEVSQGIVPYAREELYKKYSQDEADRIVDDRQWHSDHQVDPSFKKEIKGEDVSRYYLEWNGKQWIKYGNWLARPREKKYFYNPRILIREITRGSKLNACYTEEEYYNNPGIINIILKDESYLLGYLLSLINSNLFFFYHFNSSPKAKLITSIPKILIADVEHFPIIKSDFSSQKIFKEKADQLSDLIKEFINVQKSFLHRLIVNSSQIKIVNKLEEFYNHDFSIFLTELKKQKITLSLKEQEEWEPYFTETKNKINQLQAEIDRTDNQLDFMVYKLYNLTYDEVKIVDSEIEKKISKEEFDKILIHD